MKQVFKLLMILVIAMSCSNEPISEVNLDSIEVNDIHLAVAMQSATIINPIYGTQPGTATLKRNANGITASYKTSGLKPGYAYTLWWVIWNKPGECAVENQCEETDFAKAGDVEVEVLYAAGHVIGASGIGNFTARLNAGDDSHSYNAVFGFPEFGGLQLGNTYGAEVHLVLRSHGPAIPGIIDEQINSHFGGCETNLMPNFTQDADEEGECSNIEFAVFPPLEN